MIRRIIIIDEEKCNGCGLCAAACHEGAIGMVDGKARLLREDYCDGLGDCLPACPVQAISFEEREAPAYDEAAVLAAKCAKETPAPCACPGTAFACGNFHRDFMAGRVTVIGCPKLDAADYAEKLTEILRHNDVRSVTVARMTVPCCCGLSRAAELAVAACGKDIPFRVVTVATDGRIVG